MSSYKGIRRTNQRGDSGGDHRRNGDPSYGEKPKVIPLSGNGERTLPIAGPQVNGLGLSGLPTGGLNSGVSTSLLDSIRFGVANIFGDPGKVQGYGGMLNQLNQYSQNNDLLNFLSSVYANEEHGLNQGQATDFNKQLLDMYLAQIQENEKRTYNEGLRDEQRIYDSPTNQLARFMGAGISRDAALQLLGGQNAAIQTEGAHEVEGLAPSESNANRAGAMQAIGAVAGTALSAFSGLVGLGFTAAQAAVQIKLLKSHSYMSNQQAQAYDTANGVFNTLQAIGADSDAYGSVSSALTAISSAAQGGNEVAKAFMLSPHASRVTSNGAFVAPVLAQMYKDNRNASDYKQRWFAEFTNLNLQNGQIQQQTAKLAAETKNLGPIYDQIIAQTDFMEQQTEVQKQTVEYLKQQGRLVEAEAYEKEMQNAVTEGWQGMTFTDQNGEQRNGLWFASSSTLYSLVNAYDAGLAQTDETYRNYVYDQILVDQKASYYASFLKFMNEWLGADFVVNHPEHAAYYNGLEKIGYYRHIENIAKGVYEAGEHATADLGPLGSAGVNYGGTVVPQTPDGFARPNIISDVTKDDYMNTDKRGKQRKNRK